MAVYEAYKNSGAEWLGQIPADWKTGAIGSLYTQRNTKVSDTEYPPLSVTMKGIVPQLENAAKTNAHDARKLVCKGDFAINSRSDRRGSCGISNCDGSVSLINTVLTPMGNMNPSYYNWLFHTVQFADEYYKNGHGIVDDLWTTRWNDMKRILIPIPSGVEQAAIAAYLDEKISHVDAVISEAKASIEEYKAWKASVIYEAVTKGLDPDVEMKESGVEWIGEIPELWKLIRLKFLMDEIVDCPHETPEYSDSGNYYVIRTADQDVGYLRADEKMYRLDEVEYSKRIRRLPLDRNDIVYGREGERWGLACIVPESNKYCLGQRMMQFRCNKSVFYPEFARWALNSYGVYMQGVVDTFGSTSPHVNISTTRNYSIPVPPIEEQKQIADYITQKCNVIVSLITEKEKLISDLESYKKSLIFEVVTGKRKVV